MTLVPHGTWSAQGSGYYLMKDSCVKERPISVSAELKASMCGLTHTVRWYYQSKVDWLYPEVTETFQRLYMAVHVQAIHVKMDTGAVFSCTTWIPPESMLSDCRKSVLDSNLFCRSLLCQHWNWQCFYCGRKYSQFPSLAGLQYSTVHCQLRTNAEVWLKHRRQILLSTAVVHSISNLRAKGLSWTKQKCPST